eukprot:TRINITY_DN8935_c1_g1_i4.p3 TRINITY_DN8935_c1_g1~~TRINITY_DN8935_c1_g1_i4.p3  ORF type:complete len:168 (-),score=14.24 TRINITY_DN8935_c1_g1_i4:438-941(-)
MAEILVLACKRSNPLHYQYQFHITTVIDLKNYYTIAADLLHRLHFHADNQAAKATPQHYYYMRFQQSSIANDDFSWLVTASRQQVLTIRIAAATATTNSEAATPPQAHFRAQRRFPPFALKNFFNSQDSTVNMGQIPVSHFIADYQMLQIKFGEDWGRQQSNDFARD